MISENICHPLSLALMASGALVCFWLAFTVSARADDLERTFTTVERTIGGGTYEVQVRKNAPIFTTDGGGYAY